MTTTATTALSASGLSRGGHTAIDLEVHAGEIVAATGVVGSGRTTLVRCLSGTYRLDAGAVELRLDGDTVDLAGADARTLAWVRGRHLAVLDGALIAPPRLTAASAVARACRVADTEAVNALHRLRYGGIANVPIGRLRGAEARATALVVSLLKPAPILLLDEPTRGLDPRRSSAVYAWLEERRADGAVIVVTAEPGADVEAAASRSCALEARAA